MRSILHVDQNCFFASVEMKNCPQLRLVPMAVAGDPAKRHGIILAKNELAKAKGVKTAETIWQAKQKCPDLVLVPGHYEQYADYSKRAYQLYCQYTDQVESFGMDECWLDLTQSYSLAELKAVADEIRERVKAELGLSCSVGASYNKVFAKLGSDYKKPDGTTHITPDNYKNILWPLPVNQLLYAGAATVKRLERINICTIGQLAKAPLEFLRSYLGKQGDLLWHYANGLDDSCVKKIDAKTPMKSIGNSITTARDIRTESEVWQTLFTLSDKVSGRLRFYQLRASTVHVYVRNQDFTSYEKQQKLFRHTDSAQEIAKAALALFRESYSWAGSVRSLGVRVSGLSEVGSREQLSVFDIMKESAGHRELDRVVDRLRLRFGKGIIGRGLQLADEQGELMPLGQLSWNSGGFNGLQMSKEQ